MTDQWQYECQKQEREEKERRAKQGNIESASGLEKCRLSGLDRNMRMSQTPSADVSDPVEGF